MAVAKASEDAPHKPDPHNDTMRVITTGMLLSAERPVSKIVDNRALDKDVGLHARDDFYRTFTC